MPEIRERAIGYIQSKFQSCRTDLKDLVVDVEILLRYLLRWFRIKPVTHQKQVFEIVLTLLKVRTSSLLSFFSLNYTVMLSFSQNLFHFAWSSGQSKYGAESIEILNKYHQRCEIQAIEQFANDRIARDFYDEIVHILENNQSRNRCDDDEASHRSASIHSVLDRFSVRVT